jgi:hypothetical protein
MKRILIYSLVIALFLSSCSESILDVNNENSYDGNSFFTNATTAVEASTAMYSPLLYQGMFEREFYFIFDLLGYDAFKNFPLQGSLLEISAYTHNPNTGEMNYFFNSCYKLIFRTNFVINMCENWETTTDADAELKTRIEGEAKFLKALGYFWLVNCFGDVPLRKNLEDHYVLQMERKPKAEIWTDIETNLADAIAKLPLAQDYAASDYGRATRGAAVALLGKVYLYQGKHSEAITEFTKLLSAPYEYDLASSLDDMFIHDLKTEDTIFAVMHGEWQGWGVGNAYGMFGGQESWGAKFTHSGRAMEYGFNDWWNVLVAPTLVDAFTYPDESGDTYTDPRAAVTFYDNLGTKGGDEQYCDECPDGIESYAGAVGTEGPIFSWRKYELYELRHNYGQPDSYINSQIVRYADVLLMLAECYIETNDLAKALPLINQVRVRSGAFAYTSLGTQTEARTILRRERRIELAGEQSRYFDLVRWGILVQTINAEKQIVESIQPVKDYHILLPIPQSERDANPLLNAQVSNNWN